jgi:hypothetical protein
MRTSPLTLCEIGQSVNRRRLLKVLMLGKLKVSHDAAASLRCRVKLTLVFLGLISRSWTLIVCPKKNVPCSPETARAALSALSYVTKAKPGETGKK